MNAALGAALTLADDIGWVDLTCDYPQAEPSAIGGLGHAQALAQGRGAAAGAEAGATGARGAWKAGATPPPLIAL